MRKITIRILILYSVQCDAVCVSPNMVYTKTPPLSSFQTLLEIPFL